MLRASELWPQSVAPAMVALLPWRRLWFVRKEHDAGGGRGGLGKSKA